jgi:hypothetical protein
MAFERFRVSPRWSLNSRTFGEPDDRTNDQSDRRGPRQLTAAERERAYRYAREHHVSMGEAVRQLFDGDD